MRPILAIAIVVAACFSSYRYAEHHVGDSPFTTLYLHLVPAPLVEDNHDHDSPVLAELPLPGFMGIFDYRGPDAEGPPKTTIFNLQIFQIASVLLCFVLFLGVPRYVRTGKGDILSKTFAGFAMWIRDEMVYPEMGKDMGGKFLPYFLSVFFFIFFMNVMGLVPFSATPTASIFVTSALALTTLLGMLICGMVVQGPVAFWKNQVPHVPLALWPLMFIIEVFGLVIVKPAALLIRLFANMSGGHMVVLSFMALIFFFAEQMGSGAGWGITPVAVGFAVFIMIIEIFVAMLQAYIFTQLSIIFVNAAIHPEH